MSSSRPRICITSERYPLDEQAEQRYDRVGRAYAWCVAETGAVPYIVPTVGHDPELIAAHLDSAHGLILSGGDDIHPSFYGEIVLEKCGAIDEKRDLFEFELFRGAVERGMPVLGICRGMQLIAVATGGSLYQDLSYCPDAEDIHGAPWEKPREMPTVRLTPGTVLHQIIGEEILPVNCNHHQFVKTLAPSCRVSAVSRDGTIEAIEVSNSPYVLGVHWHPERLASQDRRHLKLFEALVGAAGKYARRTIARNRP